MDAREGLQISSRPPLRAFPCTSAPCPGCLVQTSVYSAAFMNSNSAYSRDWLPAPDCLQGRVILVTGAANGIGKAVAKDMAAHGATTVLLDRDVRGLEQCYDEIVAAGLPQPGIYPMDLQGAVPEDRKSVV